jgi:hypothetical protein
MTREEILAMPAGRELDALVAEKVIGLSDENLFLIAQAKGPHTFDKDGFTVGWCPSTDISAAMEAAEKFDSWEVTKMLVGIRNYKSIVNDNPNSVAYADTAPEAIAKAALLAVMEVSR